LAGQEFWSGIKAQMLKPSDWLRMEQNPKDLPKIPVAPFKLRTINAMTAPCRSCHDSVAMP
jgi:hypothetical protein